MICLLRLLFLSLLSAGAISAFAATPPKATTADLVVYGGTASGVMTAYSAAKQGLHVVLLEPTHHLGGMVTGGLSATDYAYFGIIGGYTREFYRQAAESYGTHDLLHPTDWLSEPKVGEAIFNQWLKAANVEVHLDERLKEKGGVEMMSKHVTALVTDDGKQWVGKIFADCSYEGDVMAEAHVSYVV